MYYNVFIDLNNNLIDTSITKYQNHEIGYLDSNNHLLIGIYYMHENELLSQKEYNKRFNKWYRKKYRKQGISYRKGMEALEWIRNAVSQ